MIAFICKFIGVLVTLFALLYDVFRAYEYAEKGKIAKTIYFSMLAICVALMLCTNLITFNM